MANVHWKLVPARDVLELRYGKALPETKRRHGPITVFGSNGPCGMHDEPCFDGPGIILGRKGQGPLGVKWVEEDHWVIDTAYSARLIRDDCDLRYLYYLIGFIGLNHLKDGTSNPSLNRDTFGAQLLPLPPLKSQQAIVRRLSTLDDRIALNHATNQTLEDIARTIFKSWFIDHDPVHAKAAGEPTGLPPEIDALFPSRFEEMEEGMVPEGWEVRELAGLATIDKDSVKPYEQPDSLFSHYSIPAYDDGIKPAQEPGDSIKSNKTVVKADHILLSKLNPRIPRVWLVDGKAMEPEKVAICSTEFLACSPKQADLRCFLYVLFTSDSFRGQLESAVTGTSGSHQRVRPQAVFGMSACVPAAELLAAFDALARPLFEKQALNRRMVNNLAHLRDLLLPRLVSGELLIPVEVSA